GVKDVAVIAFKNEEENQQKLCAYYCSDKAVESSELKIFLSQKLPHYMIPRSFMRISEIPTSITGKINKKALPRPSIGLDEVLVEPRNDMEDRIRKLWAEVLKRDEDTIGVTQDFFALGGNSLMVVELISKIHKELETEIAFTEVFNTPTIEAISNLAIITLSEQDLDIDNEGIYIDEEDIII
ncbi:MAG: hypothetical protein GY756_05145, partial [bacterium]|nr:hypothetical protein [bacterium]